MFRKRRLKGRLGHAPAGGRRRSGRRVGPALVLSSALMALGVAVGVSPAGAAVVPVDSAANHGAADAVGPLQRPDMRVGSFEGSDTEDWLYYWHHPKWHGPIIYSSQCAAKVERYSSVDDQLVVGQLLAQYDIGPEKTTHGYVTSEQVMKRVLVRLVRVDAGTSPCVWTAEPVSGVNGSGVDPATPILRLKVEKKAGKPVGVIVHVQLPARTARTAELHVSGLVNRTIGVEKFPRTGLISRRIELPAGRRGAVNVRVVVPATVQAAAMPEVARSVSVATVMKPAKKPKPRPVARQPKPKPKPVVRRPKGPLTKSPTGPFYFRAYPKLRPKFIKLANSFCPGIFEKIRWTSWGSATATGVGRRFEPKPNFIGCADYMSYSTTIRLLRPKVCEGTRIFTRIRWKTSSGRWSRFNVMDCPQQLEGHSRANRRGPALD